MDIATPNLYVMIHHYNSTEDLFKTVTMYADDERETVFDDIVKAKSWYWGRFAPENRQMYLKKRLFVEAAMYDAFSTKYRPPKHRCPVFFYLFPERSLSTIEERLRQRQRYDEPETKYLLIDLRDLVDTTHISFTLGDSHRFYHETLIQHQVSSGKSADNLTDHGTVFHIHELADVYSRNTSEDDLHFEVQVWDTEILERWRNEHEIT